MWAKSPLVLPRENFTRELVKEEAPQINPNGNAT